MSEPLKAVLTKIVLDPEFHARFLNTLSYLEYIGFRKIVKSQIAQDLSLETMKHMVEEGRHAVLLRKLAQRVGGNRYNDYGPENLLCGREAEIYIQSLDRACELHIPLGASLNERARITYLYATWLIEQRALAFYRIYQAVLQEAGMMPSLNSLLAEETLHLEAVERELALSDPSFIERSSDLKAIEIELYETFISDLIAAVPIPERQKHIYESAN